MTKVFTNIIYFIGHMLIFILWVFLSVFYLLYTIGYYFILKINYLSFLVNVIDKPPGHKNFRVRYKDEEDKIRYVLIDARNKKEVIKKLFEENNFLRNYLVQLERPFWLLMKEWWVVFNPKKYWSRFYFSNKHA